LAQMIIGAKARFASQRCDDGARLAPFNARDRPDIKADTTSSAMAPAAKILCVCVCVCVCVEIPIRV